ncbi:MAG: hypothetical protein PUE30_07465 [Spirochaetia bacterium]|nr:hypothetical protein [Spirochaetia bacterium]
MFFLTVAILGKSKTKFVRSLEESLRHTIDYGIVHRREGQLWKFAKVAAGITKTECQEGKVDFFLSINYNLL